MLIGYTFHHDMFGNNYYSDYNAAADGTNSVYNVPVAVHLPSDTSLLDLALWGHILTLPKIYAEMILKW